MRVSWNDFKQHCEDNSLQEAVKYIVKNGSYIINCPWGTREIECVIRIDDPASSDQIDFENNYKPNSNKSLFDVEGASLNRQKMAPRGWSYLAKSFELETSKLSSIVNNDRDNSPIGDVTIKFYDSNDTELTSQVNIDLSCAKTVVKFCPDYDYEIIAGRLYQYSNLFQDLHIWVSGGAPELGEAGLTRFVSNLNLRYFSSDEAVVTDGRVSKFLPLSTSGVPYNTNQIEFVFRHSAGLKHKIMTVLEFYRL